MFFLLLCCRINALAHQNQVLFSPLFRTRLITCDMVSFRIGFLLNKLKTLRTPCIVVLVLDPRSNIGAEAHNKVNYFKDSLDKHWAENPPNVGVN